MAVKRAGALAGIHVERIVNEPSAAAPASYFTANEEQNMLVFDFGGGTLDVSLVDCFDTMVKLCLWREITDWAGMILTGSRGAFSTRHMELQGSSCVHRNMRCFSNRRNDVKSCFPSRTVVMHATVGDPAL